MCDDVSWCAEVQRLFGISIEINTNAIYISVQSGTDWYRLVDVLGTAHNKQVLRLQAVRKLFCEIKMTSAADAKTSRFVCPLLYIVYCC